MFESLVSKLLGTHGPFYDASHSSDHLSSMGGNEQSDGNVSHAPGSLKQAHVNSGHYWDDVSEGGCVGSGKPSSRLLTGRELHHVHDESTQLIRGLDHPFHECAVKGNHLGASKTFAEEIPRISHELDDQSPILSELHHADHALHHEHGASCSSHEQAPHLDRISAFSAVESGAPPSNPSEDLINRPPIQAYQSSMATLTAMGDNSVNVTVNVNWDHHNTGGAVQEPNHVEVKDSGNDNWQGVPYANMQQQVDYSAGIEIHGYSTAECNFLNSEFIYH